MKKGNIFIIIVCISVLILGIAIFLNVSNNNIDKNLNNAVSDVSNNSNIIPEDYKESENSTIINSLLDITSPSEIVFYRNGKEHIFEYGSDEYKKIIELNILRDSEINYTKCYFHTIDDIKDKIDLLEYRYEKNNSIYFNLTGIYEYIGIDGSIHFNGSPEENIETFWVYEGNYGYGLKSSNELVEYLSSII